MTELLNSTIHAAQKKIKKIAMSFIWEKATKTIQCHSAKWEQAATQYEIITELEVWKDYLNFISPAREDQPH